MTTLIIGGAGYVGSHVVCELLASGENIIVVDNLSTGDRSAVPPEAAFVAGDCSDRQFLGALIHSTRAAVPPRKHEEAWRRSRLVVLALPARVPSPQ
jgi:UDP-glucose 4-epimerase